MSSGGTAAVSPHEPQAFKRAVRKIKCAAMVAGLAKSWQGWASDHAGKQDAIPSGWMPASIEGEDGKGRSLGQTGGVKPGVVQTGGVKPEMVQPGGVKPEMVQTGVVQPGVAQPGGVQAGGIKPKMVQPGGVKPEMVQMGVVQPGGAQSGGVQPGGVKQGMVQTGVAQPEMVQLGGVQSGVARPGGVKPEMVQPGGVKPDLDSVNAIRTSAVVKTVRPKRDPSNALVSAIRGKMEAGPQEHRPFLGNESPTRRRQMRALQGAAGGGGGAGGALVQDRKLLLRENSSLDAEDSGPGEDGESKAEQNEGEAAAHGNKHKIKITSMSDIKSRWQQWSEQHVVGQKLNPFSEEFDHDYAMAQRLRKGDSGYGRPKDGSKTAERGDRAQRHIHREMEEMVWIIRDMGLQDREGRTAITFGRLFDRYVKISDKVVGILLRCRKHKMLDFEGEMLWKGQDDEVIITLRD
ncbi:unnamed protein product [Menidia menidia]|uniref:Actin-binding Rho-activating protein n=1 Tax=Menidia menidia TaxID=238744 RepID=A0A8S4BKZ3_9TELE|nr:unnamed protein product [Menidia menidia]